MPPNGRTYYKSRKGLCQMVAYSVTIGAFFSSLIPDYLLTNAMVLTPPPDVVRLFVIAGRGPAYSGPQR